MLNRLKQSLSYALHKNTEIENRDRIRVSTQNCQTEKSIPIRNEFFVIFLKKKDFNNFYSYGSLMTGHIQR